MSQLLSGLGKIGLDREWSWPLSSNTDSTILTLCYISVTGKLRGRRRLQARSRSPWSASHLMRSMTLTSGRSGLAVMSAGWGGRTVTGWGQAQETPGWGWEASWHPWQASRRIAEHWRTEEECSSETKRVLSISMRGMLEKFYCCICCGICINT